VSTQSVLDRGLADALGWAGWQAQQLACTVLSVVHDFVPVVCPDGNTAGVKCRLEPAGASRCCLVLTECMLLVPLLCGGSIEGLDSSLSLCSRPGLFTKFTEDGAPTLYCHTAGVRLMKALLFNKAIGSGEDAPGTPAAGLTLEALIRSMPVAKSQLCGHAQPAATCSICKDNAFNLARGWKWDQAPVDAPWLAC